MFDRRIRIAQRVVTEVVDVLDECLDALSDLSLPYGDPEFPLTRHFVARERLAQHGDERAVAGEVDRWRVAVRVAAARGDVQTDERFPRSRHPGDEANQLPFRPLRLRDEFLQVL